MSDASDVKAGASPNASNVSAAVGHFTNVPMPLVHSAGICCQHGCYIGVVCPACHYERTKDLSPMGGGPNPEAGRAR